MPSTLCSHSLTAPSPPALSARVRCAKSSTASELCSRARVSTGRIHATPRQAACPLQPPAPLQGPPLRPPLPPAPLLQPLLLPALPRLPRPSDTTSIAFNCAVVFHIGTGDSFSGSSSLCSLALCRPEEPHVPMLQPFVVPIPESPVPGHSHGHLNAEFWAGLTGTAGLQ